MKLINCFIIRNSTWLIPLITFVVVFLCIWLGTLQYNSNRSILSLAGTLIVLLVAAPLLQLFIFRFRLRFKRYTGEHKEKLVKYCEQRGVTHVEFFEIKGRLPNAYATGNRKHKRVTFTSRLLEECSYEEVEAVLAHELGHHVNDDPQSTLRVIVFIFFFASWFNGEMVRATQWNLLVVSILSSVIFYLLFLVRSRRNERRADMYAATDPKAAKGLIAFFKRSQDIYKKEGVWIPRPFPLILRITKTHPTLDERMKVLGNYKSN
ncbi:MAG TPA: M48 family metallopeptidase [Patescibacteria group bacterium]